MQKPALTNKKKLKLLLGITICALSASFAFSIYHNLQNNEIYFWIHLVSIILGSFLSIVGALTFLEFGTKRLFLVMCAFIAISVAETISLVNFVIPVMPIDANIHSLITHSMVLLMLAFFAFGIFRTD